MNDQAQKFMELQQLVNEVQQAQQHLQQLQMQIEELKTLEEAIKGIQNNKPGDEVLAPLGSGIFVKTKLENADNVIMAVGNGTVVEKPISEALNLVSEQVKEMETISEQVTQHVEMQTSHLNVLQQQFQKMQVCGHDCECDHDKGECDEDHCGCNH
ncbi:MAG: prefoldin subunit alpha [archaeon]